MSHRNRVTLISALASSLALGLVLLITGGMLWRTMQDGIDRRLDAGFRALDRAVSRDDRRPPPNGGDGPRDREFRDPRRWREDLTELAKRTASFRRHDAPVSASVYELDGREIADINNGSVNLPSDLSKIQFPSKVSWKIYRSRNGEAKILVAFDSSDRQAALAQSYLALLILWPALTAILALVSYAAISSSFKPLNRLLDQVKHLGISDRLEPQDEAEFGTLAARINEYLDRIEVVIRQQEEFAVDAAHELCTPLTAMRGQLELAMMKKSDAKEYAEAAKRVITQISRLERLVESLLLAARPKDQELPNIDAQEIVEAAQARWVDRFAEKSVALELSSEACPSAIRPEELECVVDNLLANALRYSPAGSEVHMQLALDGLLVVQDEGPGIDPENREKIFERFERGTSVGRGFGIGLYLVRRLLASHDGWIKIADSDRGTRVEVQLPAARLAA